MANLLLDNIAQGIELNKPLLWLDSEAYAAKVMRGQSSFTWTNSTELVTNYSQMQSLLKPGVAPINLMNFFAQWLSENTIALNEMAGKKRIRVAIKRFLGLEQPRKQIREIVSALCATLNEPVVLVLPENGELIKWAHKAANGVEVEELTEIDIDSVSVYLADFLRCFSGLDIAGVLVQVPEQTDITPELLELYSPIINVSKHYHWALGMQVSGQCTINDREEILDFVINNQDLGCAKALNGDFWDKGEFKPIESGFYFSHIDTNLQPEMVLDRLAQLRG